MNFLNFEKVYADNNVSYLDLDYVLSQSLAGKSINNQISAIQKKNSKNLNDKEKELFEKEKSIISKKNVLAKDEFDNKVLAFKKEVSEYKNYRTKLIKETGTKRLKATTKLLEKLNPLLAKYSKENSISIIVQKKNIIIGKAELDITKDILKLLNNEIKKINVN